MYIPVVFATVKQKAASNTRFCDYRHLMLLLPFILSN
jgi:hypothetical protein